MRSAPLGSRSSYRRVVVSQQSRGWSRFSPVTLVPFGGFGDPDVADVVWKPPRNLDSEKLDLAKAQDRIARALRVRSREMEITEAELESLLGYKRGYLVRKLNGIEALTMRDLLRIANAFGASVVTAIAPDEPQFRQPRATRQSRSTRTSRSRH